MPEEVFKIEKIEKTVVYDVTTNGDGHYEYTRYSSDNWMVRMGETMEPVFHCGEIERLFQEKYHGKENLRGIVDTLNQYLREDFFFLEPRGVTVRLSPFIGYECYLPYDTIDPTQKKETAELLFGVFKETMEERMDHRMRRAEKMLKKEYK